MTCGFQGKRLFTAQRLYYRSYQAMPTAVSICCVCGEQEPNGKLFFHACEDWGHWRICVCHKCLEHIPIQRSLHEQCWECAEPPSERNPKDFSADISPRFCDLTAAIDNFEQCHAKLLEVLPFSSDERDCHPGSTNSFLSEWRKKRGVKTL